MTGSGTTNTVPVFTGTSTVGNSPITVSGSNVGIGTTSPAYQLDVQSNGPQFAIRSLTNGGGRAITFVGPNTTGNYNWLAGGQYNINNGFEITPSTVPGGTTFSAPVVTVLSSGDVGIGTTSPSQPLEVNGNIKVDGTPGTNGIIFPDGTTQTTAFIPANCGADFAESVGVTGSPKKYEPGDLLVIDPDAPGKFLKSSEPYSTMVAGIFSTKPGFVGRLHPATDPASAGEVPMAMVGRVPTKVSAENGPIKVGDLLVASSTPGYAMRGTDHGKMLGAVIGKALERLDSGTGTVMVLVTLQ